MNCATQSQIFPWNDAPKFEEVVINGQG
jgi:hypothetical protein